MERGAVRKGEDDDDDDDDDGSNQFHFWMNNVFSSSPFLNQTMRMPDCDRISTDTPKQTDITRACLNMARKRHHPRQRTTASSLEEPVRTSNRRTPLNAAAARENAF